MDATSIAFAPLIDWTAIAALAALSALIVGFAFWRRARGAFWRLVASLAVLLGLANPSLVQEERRQLPDVVFLAVDESASQAIGERQARTRAAAEYLKAALSRLPDVELREIAISGSGLDDNGSRLFGPLEETLADVPREQVAGLFVVSDGQIHDAPADLAALGITAPLHLLLTGERNEADRRLTIVKAPTFGIVGKPQELIVRVDDLAGADVGSATLTLTISGQEAQIQSIQIGRDVPITFQLERRGATLIELSVNAGPAELSLLNNRAALEVSGVRDRLRVLLVSGEPHNGERVWRNILKSDPAVDLVHFTILRPPEKQDGTPINELSLIAFPTRELFEEKLQDFDLIIFDRYRQRGVLPSIYLDNVARYVEGGGALLEAMGPASASALSLYRTPLARIMLTEPSGEVIEEGFKPEVTAVGRRHPVTATLTGIGQVGEEPSWGRWFRLIDARLPSNGETVMSGPGGRPLLVLGHVGEGRVAQLLSDQVWLWARGFEGGGPQAELLRRIAHWLMKEPDLEEEDLRAHIAGNQLIIDRRSISSDIPTIQVTAPSGELKTLNLAEGADGVQHGTLAIEEAGIYRINDGQRTILASAGPLNAKEFQDLRASDEPLGALIQASGGTALYLAEQAEPKLRKVSAERDAFGRDWLGVVSREAYVVTGIAEAPLLPAWALLALALGAAFLAWQREGQ